MGSFSKLVYKYSWAAYLKRNGDLYYFHDSNPGTKGRTSGSIAS